MFKRINGKMVDYTCILDPDTNTWIVRFYINDLIEEYNTNCYSIDNAENYAELLIKDWIKEGLL